MFFYDAKAFAFFVDGNGHYGLLGQTRVNPEADKGRGTFQAIVQSFDLNGDARMNDRASFRFRLGIFSDPRTAYLGDRAHPADCDARQPQASGSGGPGSTVTRNDDPAQCAGSHQDTSSPRYQNYYPQLREAYARYAFDYCIAEAGRRSRDFGLGIFNNAGRKPFETDASVYDGVTCDVNLQKTQVIGFSVGFDKLQESGNYTDVLLRNNVKKSRGQGALGNGDDLDQFFFKLTYDDRKANSGAAFTRTLGIYFSNAFGDDSKTDLKFLDFFSALYFSSFTFKNEFLFRLGKSADPNWIYSGGANYLDDDDGSLKANKLDAAALAGTVEWNLVAGGTQIGPTDYNQGSVKKHVLFLDYAYAPGDEQGYYADRPYMSDADKDAVGLKKRAPRSRAISFHRNFKPALLMFNGTADADEKRVDGVYNPSRFVNATLLGLGYRFESMEYGNFETKLLTAFMNRKVPEEVRTYFESPVNTAQNEPSGNRNRRPIGYYGNSFGYELDFLYNYVYGKEIELIGGIAVLLPGKAYKTLEDENPGLSYMLETGAVFKF